jgi:molybdate/tungstate transport system permease protein
MKHGRLFFLIAAILSGGLMMFVILPLLVTLFSVTPASLWDTLLDPQVVHSIAITFSAASIATVIAMLGGIPLAYLLARRSFRGKRLVEAVINLPIVIPHTAAGIALLMVFGRYGLLGSLFYRIGITFTDNLAGIVLAMMFVSLPFLVNTSRESFALIDIELERVALIDGANPWQSFWHIAIPLASRGIAAGALMMWARGISEFGAVVILAYHPKIVPVLVFERFSGFGLRYAVPVAALLIFCALAVFTTLRLLLLPKQAE